MMAYTNSSTDLLFFACLIVILSLIVLRNNIFIQAQVDSLLFLVFAPLTKLGNLL